MNKKTKCLVKTLHLLSACLWLGAATSVVLLQCLKGWSEDGRLLLALNENFSILDFAVIIPGAMGSALTGFVMCKKTSWGFTRYWWIMAKGLMTIAAIQVGTALLGPWQMKMVELSRQPGNVSYDLIRALFTAAGFVQVIMLVCIVTISAFKPWGRRVVRQKETNTIHPQAKLMA